MGRRARAERPYGSRRPPTPVLLFLPTFETGHAPVPPEGWHSEGEPYRLYRTLDEAEAAALAPDGQKGWVLVLDPDRLSVCGEEAPTANHIPRAAVLNVDRDGDYWRPGSVGAGGGYVVRRTDDGGVEVLLIFRRGAWDLPKGKLDPGETVQEAAHREVSEEVGVKKKKLTVLEDLGTTVHGYVWAKHNMYAVKTTFWFSMSTEAESFKPEKREGIEKVDWVPWAEAADRLGFETLRRHLASLDPDALGV